MSARICLNMIVKDEAPVITRCLASVLPLIDYWVIVDTGSADETPGIIASFFAEAKIPGELHHRPWQDFAHNRSEALALARPHGDYTLIIDADDSLEIPQGFEAPPLSADSYVMDISDGSIRYQRTQLVRNALPWRYRGVLHEFLDCEGTGSVGHFPVLMRRNHDGARRRDPRTYQRDAAVLEAALEAETDSFLRARYTFYLAQSWRDCGEPEKALQQYLARAEMGFWQEETFISLYAAGQLKERLGHPPEEVVATYLRASDASPTRAEALHAASRLCRFNGWNRRGMETAARAIDLELPTDGLFVEPWVYQHGALDEFAVNAYWAGEHRACLDASVRILATTQLDEETMQRVSGNARFAVDRLREAGLDDSAKPPTNHRESLPKVLIAILAKDQAGHLPRFLASIDALDYPADRIAVHIRTNNNTDETASILREWAETAKKQYAAVEFDDEDVPERVQDYEPHDWNALRFSVLGRIRQASLGRTTALGCDFYFVVDVDNFIAPPTLRRLVDLNLPIVAPLLGCADPDRPRYANFHQAVDDNGYFRESPEYDAILDRRHPGLHEVAVVHCTYLVRSDVIPRLAYEDGSGRHEYVLFSESARRSGIPQYLDNRAIYGRLTFSASDAPILPFLDTKGLVRIEPLENDAPAERYPAEAFIADHRIDAIDAPARLAVPAPLILFAILAKQKEASLPLFLRCLDRLDYPKDRIVLYVRTNNNTDKTREMLEEWLERNGSLYRAVEYDPTDVEAKVEQFDIHEWNETRFRVLSKIRDTSLRKTLEHGCDFYFTADVDTFVRPETLRELVALDRPLVAPFLRPIVPNALNSNFFAGINESGYYVDHPRYNDILWRHERGVLEVPLVHMVYLVRQHVLDRLNYDDGSGRYEFVIFADSARKAGIPLCLDNRRLYGYITCDDDEAHSLANFGRGMRGQAAAAQALLEDPARSDAAKTGCTGTSLDQTSSRFQQVYTGNEWEVGSGLGSLAVNNVPYIKFLQNFMVQNGIRTVVDLGCGDWQFSRHVDWSSVEYHGLDVVPTVIEANRRHFGGGNIQFSSLRDIAEVPAGDLLVCKDVLQHLSNELIRQHVEILVRRFRYLLFTNDYTPEDRVNLPIADGDFRPVRLDRAPLDYGATSIFEWELFWTAGGRVASRKLVQLILGNR